MLKPIFENMRTAKAHTSPYTPNGLSTSMRIRSVERVYIINLKMQNTSEHVGLSLTFSEYSRDAANEHL